MVAMSSPQSGHHPSVGFLVWNQIVAVHEMPKEAVDVHCRRDLPSDEGCGKLSREYDLRDEILDSAARS